ncbi:Crp/Fnr family transcriptional regulator [Christiangramia crocea]|uniref:Crp/Fnr family transcriptional regulator n=1 Tax=Christiangramia crocea TaxID=2904124 RepID=A0A9X1UWR3_9FLAO|nr:Crp/Fnr family transcriptional regulator [Gramella crocea]MCG9970909.1 Crp/Fnr family transcriptional regulator [Gramella crocea]
MIPSDLLLKNGAIIKSFSKNDFVFKEGQKANYYFQIVSGEVKMNNILESGKEFIQSFFKPPQSFGEPPLFTDIDYPANAIATTKSEIILLKKASFIKLLKSQPEIHLKITTALAHRLYYKSIMATEISYQEPEHRVLRLLDYLKYNIYNLNEPFSFKVGLTRQEIADLTGLRVETVIRTTRNLQKKNELKIKNRKLYR